MFTLKVNENAILSKNTLIADIDVIGLLHKATKRKAPESNSASGTLN